jgi:putative ABC transport system permease protein
MVLQDVKYGWRMLWKSPAFTAVALTVVALGIGANTAIFSVVDIVLLRPLPFAEPDRLVAVWEDATHMGFPHNTPAPANFIDWKKQNQFFSDMAALADRTLNLTGDGEPEKLDGYVAGWNLFPLLGVKPALGRTFLPEEDRPGGPKVLLVSHGLWKRRFGGDPGLVGREIRVNDENHTVVGVMPPEFQFPALEHYFKQTEIWTPLAFGERQWAQRGAHFLYVIARLKPGVTLDQARIDMSLIMQR